MDAEGINFGALRFYRIKLFLSFLDLFKICHPVFWLSLNSSLEWSFCKERNTFDTGIALPGIVSPVKHLLNIYIWNCRIFNHAANLFFACFRIGPLYYITNTFVYWLQTSVAEVTLWRSLLTITMHHALSLCGTFFGEQS